MKSIRGLSIGDWKIAIRASVWLRKAMLIEEFPLSDVRVADQMLVLATLGCPRNPW